MSTAKRKIDGAIVQATSILLFPWICPGVGEFGRSRKRKIDQIRMDSTTTNTIVATTRINQNRPASLAATGPAGFKMEGAPSPQAARSSEASIRTERVIPQRFFAPRNIGILTSQSPKTLIIDGQQRPSWNDTLSIVCCKCSRAARKGTCNPE